MHHTFDKTKLIILGLDGGTWDVLAPLIEKDKLKHLKSLTSRGVKSHLISIIPPVTGPAWPVLATGMNPGRLGVFDFYNRKDPQNYTLYPVRSSVLHGKALWDLLSERGYRVGVFGYPMLVPTYPINGWMIAGLGASKLHQWTWPAALAQELEVVARPYIISMFYGLPKYQADPELLFKDMEEMLTGQLAALEYLLVKYPVDVLFAVLSVSDVLAHTMWHLWDDEHPNHNPEMASLLLPKIHSLWIQIDQAITRLSAHLGSDGNLLIVSDHGFGPSFGVFHTNTWLEKHGYLKKRSGLSHQSNRLRGYLVSNLSSVFEPVFRKIQGTPAHFALRESILREIDLPQTRAFALETTDVCGMIFINRDYARQRGLEEEQFVSQTAVEICSRLLDYGLVNHLDFEAHLAKDLYHGPYVSLAPEIIFKIQDSQISATHKFSNNVYAARLHHPLKTGTHRQGGIFLGYGSKFQKGVELPASLSILDVAPTVYHLLDQPVPADLDGRVAVEALLPEFRRVVESRYDIPRQQHEGFGDDLTLEDSAAFQQRLRDLGYLE